METIFFPQKILKKDRIVPGFHWHLLVILKMIISIQITLLKYIASVNIKTALYVVMLLSFISTLSM